ncbi:hypothetical protein ACRAWD_11695 [Caulobacter segnis]
MTAPWTPGRHRTGRPHSPQGGQRRRGRRGRHPQGAGPGAQARRNRHHRLTTAPWTRPGPPRSRARSPAYRSWSRTWTSYRGLPTYYGSRSTADGGA